MRPIAHRFAPSAISYGAVLFLLATAARADDTRYQDYPIGSRATTLGGAFTAIADDASGLTYNPAGLCDTQQININLSTSLYGLERQGRTGSPAVNGDTFSLATLATLNVIPGEAGSVKGIDTMASGSRFAYGFDLTVPSFRSYGTDESGATVLHTRIQDRTFDAAGGGAMRLDSRWSIGAAVHFVLRLFDDTEDALVTNGAADPRVGVYHAEASFANAGLLLTLGAKYHADNNWFFGAALSTPSVRVYSSGSVQVQDVTTDPSIAPPHTTVNITNSTNVQSATEVPVVVRLGAAHIEPAQWTASGQLTLDLPVSYDRFQLDAATADRLELQTHVDRRAVLNVNIGGEYLLAAKTTIALGAFTDFSTAPKLEANPDGTIVAGTSHLDNVSLYGGTASVGLLGEHSTTHIGVSLSYGKGEEAQPVDPTGISMPGAFTRSEVSQLFFYVFLAGTSRF